MINGKGTMKRTWMTYWVCMVIGLMTLTACADEPFPYADGDTVPVNGKEVDIRLGYCLPEYSKQTVTRALSYQQEHQVQDLFVLIFKADGTRVFGKYFTMSELREHVSYAETSWDDSAGSPDYNIDTNSTHGYVNARAVLGVNYIFAIANILPVEEGETSTAEALGVKTNKKTGTTSLKDQLDAVLTIQQLSSLQVELNDMTDDHTLLERTHPYMMMYGAYRKASDQINYDIAADYSSLPEGKTAADYAGYVNVTQEAYFKTDANGTEYYDLYQPNAGYESQRGRIYLRRISSYVQFRIQINKDVFEDFKPESWEVVHVPVRTFLMDQYNNTEHIKSDAAFRRSKPSHSISHIEHYYGFDFYMFENHKDSRDVSSDSFAADVASADLTAPAGGSVVDWDGSMLEGGETPASVITDFYTQNWGATFDAAEGTNNYVRNGENWYHYVPGSGWVEITAENDKKAVFYDSKRELEMKKPVDKGANGQWAVPLKNSEGQSDYEADANWDPATYQYDSHKFVYVEPKATYVIIKGRLRFKNNGTGVTLHNIAVSGTETTFDDAYADVEYIVHLGYWEDGSAYTNKFKNFTSLRNTIYTYYITINGINSIYTEVELDNTTGAGPMGTEPQPSAKGRIGVSSSGHVYNTDAHFNSFILELDKDNIQNFSYEIYTPFTPDGIRSADVMTSTQHDAIKNNPDFNWIKFRRCTNQEIRKYLIDNGKYRHAMTYARTQDSYMNNTVLPLMDLYELQQELNAIKAGTKKIYNFPYSEYETALANHTLTNTSADAAWWEDKEKTWDAADFYNGDRSDYASYKGVLYYTVYVDEYYYHTPPTGVSWSSSVPYWKYFVNQPARYLSIGTGNSSLPYKYSKDNESTLEISKLMIVQPSIQTFYTDDQTVTDLQNALGVEHYNETYAPRWTDYYDNSDLTQNHNNYNHTDGWQIAKTYVVNKAAKWSDYVSDEMDMEHNNLYMAKSDNFTGYDWHKGQDLKESDGTSNYWKANAIRLCMNRNRDENGNNLIDDDELKWYLPASEQLDVISMNQWALYDPLFEINNFYTMGTDTWLSIPDPDNPQVSIPNYQTQHLYEYHFMASDCRYVTTEEVMVTNAYSGNGNHKVRPAQMRCVRNLSKNEDGQSSYVSSDVAADIIEAVAGEENMFNMQNLDPLCLRKLPTVEGELQAHYIFSDYNKPYKKFKVAKKLRTILSNNNQLTIRDLYNNYAGTGKSACHTYSENPDGSDIGAWRVPNFMELSLIYVYYRDMSSIPEDLRLSVGTFSNSSWNFYPMWARVGGIRLNADFSVGHSTFLSTPTNTYDANKRASSGPSKFDSGYDINVRCVRDVWWE